MVNNQNRPFTFWTPREHHVRNILVIIKRGEVQRNSSAKQSPKEQLFWRHRSDCEICCRERWKIVTSCIFRGYWLQSTLSESNSPSFVKTTLISTVSKKNALIISKISTFFMFFFFLHFFIHRVKSQRHSPQSTSHTALGTEICPNWYLTLFRDL